MRTGDKDGAIHARNFRRGGVGEEGWVTRSQRATTSPKTLEELGISKTQASRWPPRDRRSPRRGPLVQIHELALIEGAALEQRRSEALGRIPMRPDEFQRVMFTYPPDLVPMGPQTALDARQRVIARHLPVRIPWNLLAQFRRPFSELPPPEPPNRGHERCHVATARPVHHAINSSTARTGLGGGAGGQERESFASLFLAR